MVIDKSTAFALRCPTCSKLSVHQLNIFQLSGGRTQEFFCDCGSQKISVTRKGSNYVSLSYFCIICDERHSIVLPRKLLWSKSHLNPLVCLNTDLNLGYYGPYHLIRKELDRQQEELNSMANELGFDEFVDPEVMLDILDYLHDIAATGGLYCECGTHDINIELFSDRIELSCNNCNSVLKVPASCQDDVEQIKNKGEVIIRLPHKKTTQDKI